MEIASLPSAYGDVVLVCDPSGARAADAFGDVSDAATRFVSGNWSAIERLALGA
jgi:hypothetical protein